MIIKEINDGPKADYAVSGDTLNINDEIALNLARYERDDANHIDICRDAYGNLVTGVIPGVAEAYVAQVDIPPRVYLEKQLEKSVEPAVLAEDGNAGGMSEPGIIREPVPFDIDNCTLSLWAVA